MARPTIKKSVLVVAVILVSTAYSMIAASLAAMSARGGIAALDGSLGEDAGSARARVERVAVSATSAEFATLSPAVTLAESIPALGRDVAVVRTVAETIGRAGRKGRATFELLQSLAGDRSIARAFYRDGRLNFAALERLRIILRELEPFLDELGADISALEKPTFDPVNKVRKRIVRAFAGAGTALATADRILLMVPDLTGKDRVRRFLLALQSPSEARGSGGIIGLYGVLRTDAGRITLERVEPILNLNEGISRPVPAPRWFSSLYGGLEALEDVRHANLGLHFPTVAETLLEYYERTEGESLDGVITLDPIVLEQITRATGPLGGPGWDRKVGPKNARRMLLHDVYLKFGQYHSRAQNEYLMGVVDDLLTRLDSGRFGPLALAEGLTRAARWKHLKIFARDEELNGSLHALGLDADPTTAGRNVQAVWHNNFTGSKVDYFLHRALDVEVTLNADGSAAVATRVTLTNEAPTTPSSLLIRPLRRRFPNGHNRMTFSVAAPAKARGITYTKDGKRGRPFRGREDILPVVWDVVDIPSKEEVELEVSYEIPIAVIDGAFELTLWPQALVRPDTFSVTVHPPPGQTFVEVFPARRHEEDSYVLEGRLFGVKTVRTTLSGS